MPTPAAVSRIVNDTGQTSGCSVGQEQPAFNGLPAVAVEGDVVGSDQFHPGLDRFETGVERELACFGESPGPKGVEILGLVAFGMVFFKLFQGKIEKHK